MTVEEMAKLLRVNRNTVYELSQRGEIPGKLRIGRSLRFHRDTVLQWLSRGNACVSRDDRRSS
ncbi:MAG: helix-turn-helix domain-containing protein [Myxococcota bacterium]|nr:helix-turn-helix domain-containing protein [Myxococcota bacterium]